MTRRPILVGALVAVAATGWGACEYSGVAGAVPNCGGQHAAPQPVPYSCVLPFKVIDGTGFSAVVHADGSSVSVTINLDAPRPIDTPARIVHHEDISGAGGAADEAQGTIPAGSTSITLRDSVPCRAGQLDVKVWHVGNGQAEGRIGGPWITNGTDCQVPTTTSPAPPVTSGPPGSTGPPTVPAQPGGPPTGTLPPTGIDIDNDVVGLFGIALILGAGGAACILAAEIVRRVREQ